MSEKKIYSLSQLTRSIERIIQQHCDRQVWIKAEIVRLNYYRKTGHCYPTLVEKKNGRVIAELRGNIWSSNFEKINGKFKDILKEELKDNMTVVVQGNMTYHPVHGLTLNIVDIDPEYTLGELAREKAETIERLKKEKLFEANKGLSLPMLPKTIAVISVDTSKGYLDFLNIIDSNPWGYRYHFLLFPAILQGERAIGSILHQLKKINGHHEVFDAVAIIRGGGGEIGLSCFDNYRLAREIATFPIPVLTGIGHSSNETVSELVSFKSFITPTKIAEFLLSKFHDLATPLRQHEEKILDKANWMFRSHKIALKDTARLFSSLTRHSLESSKTKLQQNAHSIRTHSNGLIQVQRQQLLLSLATLRNSSQQILDREKHEIQLLQQNLLSSAKLPTEAARHYLNFSEIKLQMLSPLHILKRGYSITRYKGKVVGDIDHLPEGGILDTQVFNGNIKSHIINLEKYKHNG